MARSLARELPEKALLNGAYDLVLRLPRFRGKNKIASFLRARLAPKGASKRIGSQHGIVGDRGRRAKWVRLPHEDARNQEDGQCTYHD